MACFFVIWTCWKYLQSCSVFSLFFSMFLCMEMEVNRNIKHPTGKVWAIRSTKKWMIAAHTRQRAEVMIFNPFDVWRLLHGKYVSKTTNKSRERQQKSSISILFPQNIHSPHIILFLTCGQSCGINLFCETIVTIAIYPRREEAAPLGLSCHNGHWIVTSHPPTLHYPSKHELNDDGSLYSFIQSGLATSETNMTEDSWPESGARGIGI